MKKGVVIAILVFLFLVSCSRLPQGERPQDTAAVLKAVSTGTQGVYLSTLPRYPPDVLYDQNEFVAIVEVRNRGNYDLQPQDCWVRVTGFDPNILGQSMVGARSCAENVRVLEGKNIYNTQGGFNQLEFRSTNVKLPEGVFEYTPTLHYMTCYNYHTIASPQVCVDPLLYQVTAEQKTCIPRDVGMGGGQGGPVGVSFVGVDMVGKKAIFEINVVNSGGGKAVSPETHIQDCGGSNLNYQDLDRVKYEVQLTGASLVDCKPSDHFVRLVNNQGKIICSFNLASGSAYETPLRIDLDYGYIDSIQKPVRIVQTPQ